MQKNIKRGLAVLAIGALSLTGCSEIEAALNNVTASTADSNYEIESVSVSVQEAMDTPVSAEVKAESKKAIKSISSIKLIPVEESMSGYSRDEFPHWQKVIDLPWQVAGSDEDWKEINVPASCDVRQAILIEDSVTKPEYNKNTCNVTSGSWVDTYGIWDSNKEAVSGLGDVITDPSKIDIDHIIPLAGAWRLGANDWNTEKRTRFANDPLNLIASEASANRSKGDQLIDKWAPYAPDSACDYANKYVKISNKYDLGMTDSIHNTLETYLNRCVSEEAPNFWEL